MAGEPQGNEVTLALDADIKSFLPMGTEVTLVLDTDIKSFMPMGAEVTLVHEEVLPPRLTGIIAEIDAAPVDAPDPIKEIGGIKYFVDTLNTNYVGQGTIVSTGFSSPEELATLFNGRQQSRLQASQKTGLRLVFDFKSAKPVDLIAILNHNFTSGVTLSVQASTDPLFASTPFSQVLVYNESQIITILSSTQTYRYWRLNIDDATNIVNPAIGELIFGQLVSLAKTHAWGDSEGWLFMNENQETAFGQHWVYNLAERRGYSNMGWDQLTDTDIEEVMTMLFNAKGSAYPVLFMNGDANPNDAVYGHFVDEYGRRFNFTEVNSLADISIIEQPRPNYRREIA